MNSSCIRETLLKKLIKLIEDEEFKLRHKAGGCSSHFTRDSKLGFQRVLVFILNGVKSSLQRELDDFFGRFLGLSYPIRHVTKSAFSQARQKLSFTAFVEMNRLCSDYFYAHANYKRWRGKRVFAVDGSTLLLPEHPDISSEFPRASDFKQARISIMYDPLNELIHDCLLDNIHVDERTLLDGHLDHFERDDLLLLDRGYPSFRLINELGKREIHFCMRMCRGFNTKIDAFRDSNKKEQIVYFSQTGGIKVKFKLYKVALPGEDEILLTDIIDRKLSVKDFELLYHLRWGSEEGFKYLKARMETPNFSGKTPAAVRQDFHAKAFIMTLEAILRFPLDRKIHDKNTRARLTKKQKHPQKINRTTALSLLMKCSLFIFLKKDINGFLRAFDDIVINTTEARIKGRASPRKPQRVIKYYQNYKRC